MNKKSLPKMPWKRTLEPITFPEVLHPLPSFHARPTVVIESNQRTTHIFTPAREQHCPICRTAYESVQDLFCGQCGTRRS